MINNRAEIVELFDLKKCGNSKDHCHSTGKVRALLCGQCNQLLGQAKENINTLRASIKYLEKHSGY